MATNPMQKKARNAFLLGFIIMLVISLVAGVVLYLTVIKDKQEKKAEEEELKVEVMAFVLSQPVKSGKPITSDMLMPITVYQNTVPDNYVDATLLNTFQLMDTKGNVIRTDAEGNYIMDGSNKIGIGQDEKGYYKMRNRSDGELSEYIELLTVPVLAKVDMSANTLLTTSTIKRGKLTTNDVRLAEFNVVSIPMFIDVGDFIDIRMMITTGQDFIVVSKKEVVGIVGDTIAVNLTEDEILMMNCAIVESYKLTASVIYAVPYVEPGLQDEAIPTYPINAQVIALMNQNPNITYEAKAAIAARQREDGGNLNYLRDTFITPELNKEDETTIKAKVEQSMQKQKENAKKAREAYLKELQAQAAY